MGKICLKPFLSLAVDETSPSGSEAVTLNPTHATIRLPMFCKANAYRLRANGSSELRKRLVLCASLLPKHIVWTTAEARAMLLKRPKNTLKTYEKLRTIS